MNPIQIELADTFVTGHQESLRQEAEHAIEIAIEEPRWRQALGDSLISIGERISGHHEDPDSAPIHSLRAS